MYVNDAVLLDRWRAQGDADAFATLISRHASMVYGASLRVVRNPGDAEEVAQECFLELMKGPRGVKCLGAWLHTVATRRALDRVKSDIRREHRERRYAESLDLMQEGNWDDTRAYVDEAIAALPEELRVPVVLRFLEGHTQEAIAETLSLSRTTTRTRIEKGITTIREHLKKRGVLVAAATLSAGLEAEATSAAPQALIAELGKRALAMKVTPTIWGSAAGAKWAMASVLIGGLGLTGAWAVLGGGKEPETNVVVADVSVDERDEVREEPSPPPQATPAVVPAAEVEEVASDVAPLVEEETPTAGWRLDLTPSEEFKESLQKPVRIEFEDIHVKDVMEFMQDSFDLNIVVDPRVVAPEVSTEDGDQIRMLHDYFTDGQIRHVDLRDKPLEEALAIMTGMLNLTYKIRGNVLWVSSSAQITQDLTVPLPSAPFSEGEILEIIAKPVNIEFEDIHLSDVLQFIHDSYRIAIDFDHEIVMPEVKPDEEPPPVTTNFVTDGWVPYINLRDIPLSEALFNITRMLNLTYRVERDRVYITTPDRIKKSL